MDKKRYILVGSSYMGRDIRGSRMDMGLQVVGSADTYEEAKALTTLKYDQCGGLLLWIDTQTGLPGEPNNSADLKF